MITYPVGWENKHRHVVTMISAALILIDLTVADRCNHLFHSDLSEFPDLLSDRPVNHQADLFIRIGVYDK